MYVYYMPKNAQGARTVASERSKSAPYISPSSEKKRQQQQAQNEVVPCPVRLEHCLSDFINNKKQTCIDTIPDYEPGSFIKKLLVENRFINEKCEVLTQNKEIPFFPDIISIPPNKASSSNSIMNWLKHSTESSNLKPITRTSVLSSTQDTPSGLSFLDNFLKTTNGSFSPDFHIDQMEDNTPQYIILITTHGTISQNKTIVPSSYTKNIVKITASTPGTVNYIMPGEVTGWEDEIKKIGTLDTRFDTMGTIGANIKNFAESQSPYYKRAVQLYDMFGSNRLSSAIKAWDKCSMIDSTASITAQEDFQNYYDNAAFGYHSWYTEGKQEAEEAEETFYDKTYTNKGLFADGSKEGLRCTNMKLGLIKIFDCSGEKWEDDFTIMRDPSTNGIGYDKPVKWDNTPKYKECKLSDILYTIKKNDDYNDVVIIDLTCSVPAKGYLDCLYAQAIQKCLYKGGSKSKKRKRKSNKTRKRRRKPSRNPRKHNKHQKSKRNPNKRRTKRK